MIKVLKKRFDCPGQVKEIYVSKSVGTLFRMDLHIQNFTCSQFLACKVADLIRIACSSARKQVVII